MAMSKIRSREGRFTNSEKQDLVDIICNEDGERENGEPAEPTIVVLRSKTIFNKLVRILWNILFSKLSCWAVLTRDHVLNFAVHNK